ncbi:MAG: AraC family transcriptional regulator [Victivallaceae bacterium]|nr:AraC family transcriptional regulator [Victivallaceae bacterium]
MNCDLPTFSHAGHYSGKHGVSSHRHIGAEVVYVSRGSCITDFPGESLEAGNGELYIIAPEVIHTQRNHEFTETYYVVFSVSPTFFDCSSRMIDIKQDKEIVLWLQQLTELNNKMLFQQCRGLTYTLLSRIAMLERRLHSESTTIPQLTRAINYIENHLPESALSQTIIAKQSGISVSYLKKLFRQEFQTSPMKFVQQARMRKALQLLRNQYMFINEISEKCGYPNPNYFARLFKQIHHKTPTEFRNTPHYANHDFSPTAPIHPGTHNA